MRNRFLSEVQIDDILKDAISTFGKQAQLMQSAEELAELTVECSKLARGICNIENLHKELADVRIMLRQIEMIAGTNVESGQLCIEIAERDALERLGELCKEERQCAEPNIGVYDVGDLINKAHISTNNNNYVEVQMCRNCKHSRETMLDTTAPRIVCEKGYSTNRFRCQEWERKEQPSGVTTTNATGGFVHDNQIFVDKTHATLIPNKQGFDIHEKEVLSTISDSVADNITKSVKEWQPTFDKEPITKDTCANCIFRSDTKKEDSFIDFYWCANRAVYIEKNHSCTAWKQRD